MLYIDKFYAPADEDCGCVADCECEEVMSQEELEELFADAEMLEIESEDGEKLEFFVVDDFEYQDHDYLVLMSREEPFGYFIVRETIEDDESYLDTLEEAEEPAVYEFYEALLDASEEDDCCCDDDAEDCCCSDDADDCCCSDEEDDCCCSDDAEDCCCSDDAEDCCCSDNAEDCCKAEEADDCCCQDKE